MEMAGAGGRPHAYIVTGFAKSARRATGRLRRRATAVPVMLVMLLTASLAAAPHGPAVEEYQLKAAVLYNLAKFVEWPPEAFPTARDPLVICILGVNPFGAALQEAVTGKGIEERKAVVQEISDARQAGGCRILFIGSSERKRVRAVLAEIKGSGVLTVGDTVSFAAEGGIINFKLESGKVRLQVNVDAAERQKLRISSKLLSLAQIVRQ